MARTNWRMEIDHAWGKTLDISTRGWVVTMALTALAFCWLAGSGPAEARPDLCTTTGQTVRCQGNHSQGVKGGEDFDSASANTLEVDALSQEIQTTDHNRAGIEFRAQGGGNVIIRSGSNAALVSIRTSGREAAGIAAGSRGTPPNPPEDAFLNIPVPPDPAGDDAPAFTGGTVRIESRTDIDTGGDHAHGILVESDTAGFPSGIIERLESFSDDGITFEVTSVEGSSDNVSTAMQAVAITGRLLYDVPAAPCDTDTDPDCRVDPDERITYDPPGAAGAFTIVADGTFTFELGDGFDDLAVGSSRASSIGYELEGQRGAANKKPGIQGELMATVTRVADTGDDQTDFSVALQTYFGEYRDASRTQDPQPTVFPDLPAYVNGLLESATAGGAGNNVTVTAVEGAITTAGAAAHGVFARSTGKGGGRGRNGGGFFSFGSRKPTAGGKGNDGGNVTVTVDGSITTTHSPGLDKPEEELDDPEEASFGVLALSRAGDGGRGGNGGTWYNGRRGGTGGTGGEVGVFGEATIHTLGDFASGIVAISQGGFGGNGGDGGFVTDGEHGGFGGQGGPVNVDGGWGILTEGDQAHGVWAKSLGGNAGTGGSGGWLAGSPAPGGQATDGGSVSLTSTGEIETLGDDAFGLYGQSVGGFGGQGGTGGSIFYSRGGDGESAGSGGNVTLHHEAEGSVTTRGARAHGVYAQSIGGGGGSGGGGGGIVAVGGSGKAGGFGGEVVLINEGEVDTFGENARGLYAQSVGGGGGDGGDSKGLVALGGRGSGTSDGGPVSVTNRASVETRGTQSSAIFVESIGGGGGDGGSSSGLVSIGGNGGGGGNADDVLVSNQGHLVTAKSDSSGIFAQSVGGGGGNGGGAYSSGGVGPIVITIGVGGDGGKGGDAGELVSVENLGPIETGGDRSHGVFAQSVGGGGGNGGYAISRAQGGLFSLSVALGGDGGQGGVGKRVAVTSDAEVATAGADAHGVFAQSVGGGGGSGGFSVALSSGALAGSFGLGGQGEAGGDAGEVEVSVGGSVDTEGEHAYGVLAQSVGGGGGDGGFSVAGAIGGVGVGLSFGGKGDGGGAGNRVELETSARVTTRGRDAHALLAQSVGGGGGSGGFSAGGGAGLVGIGLSFGGKGGGGGEAGEVSLQSSGEEVITAGERAYGMLAQSVGGGGGSGGFSVGLGAGEFAGAFSMGGSGAGGGSGRTVTLLSASDVSTASKDAHGIVAQSVGGGGGSGGFSVAAALSTTVSLAASLGGSGGGGGDGGAVTVGRDPAGAKTPLTGDIETEGDRAYGVLAQSVGGGGGDGGFAVAGALTLGPLAGAFGLGGSGDGGGSSGAVELYSANHITTRGTDAHGVVAQSVGGGGGSGGFSVAGGVSPGGVGIGASIGGSGAQGGGSGAVTTDLEADISTFGDHAYGVLAQSVGGGGGDGGFSLAGAIGKGPAVTFGLGGGGGPGGDGSTVALTTRGEVRTEGELAYGVFAQSVGGGGGSGGFSIAGSFAADSGGLSASLGGEGDEGGDAGTVTIEQDGVVATRGDGSHGLLAQSVGGGGGAGGFAGAITGAFGNGASVSVSLGGDGGEGGDAEQVGVANTGEVSTGGTAAYGVFAQSVGGGGGDGGGSVAIAIGKADKQVNLSAALGGTGGPGGTGGAVEVENAGRVDTDAAQSHGIVAQSIGGGGGTGGFSATGSLSAGTNAKQLAVSVGGAGGDGSNSGPVAVTNSGDIVVRGEKAKGIFAQSVGGGGGDGGFSFSGTFAGPEAKNLSVSIGGFGGDGGFAGNVSVTNLGRVDTFADAAHAISAQSVGGGGGNGGASVSTSFGVAGQKSNVNLNVSVGGFGGDGNYAGEVRVENDGGAITTRGDDAYGIQAQSVGGGGGNGGSSLSATVGIDPGKDGKVSNFNLAVGGFGGAGGAGGKVIVGNEGMIDTAGNESHGIFAQSIGGGGGNGGSARTISLVLGKTDEEEQAEEAENQGGDPPSQEDGKKKKPKENRSLEIAMGGFAGDGNTGGEVTVANAGRIITRGADAHGIFVQSIGGGGGTGGNGAHGVPDDLPIPTVIDEKLRQQLDERDKLGKKKLSIVVGGRGGSGNDGDDVIVDQAGDIATLNNGSYAVLAQSIGAGGGVGGNGVIGEEGNLGIGGKGGAAGDGGRVDVSFDGNIDAAGVAAHGIFAQSVGGGGGIAGDLDFGAIDAKEDGILGTGITKPKFNIGIGLDGGSAGDGGEVRVASRGNITTRGHGSNAIFAQSVGGGGGVGGDVGFGTTHDIANTVTCLVECDALIGSAGGDGSGGEIHITHAGNITTLGDVSHGIFAQSAGGTEDGVALEAPVTDADGNPLDAEGNPATRPSDIVFDFVRDQAGAVTVLPDRADLGGDIDIEISGDIFTEGAHSNGIFAQSVGGDGNGDISIRVLGGTVRGGSESGAGIRFKDGAANTLDNRGTITSKRGLLGTAVFGGDGDETIHNRGSVIGNLDLGGGVNTFNNHPDGTLASGATVELGGGRLNNDGLLSPGGEDRVQTSRVAGDLLQSAAGAYAVDVSFGDGASDHLDIEGQAELAGEIRPKLLKLQSARPPWVKVLSADAGLTDNGVSVADTLVLDYELRFEGDDLELALGAVEFAVPSLNSNQQAVGRHFNEALTAGGSPGLAPVATTLANVRDPTVLAEAMDKLHPESSLGQMGATVAAGLSFANALMSCRAQGVGYSFIAEGECHWMQLGHRRLRVDRSAENLGFDESAYGIAAGAQVALSEQWRGGLSFGYERSDIEAHDRAVTRGEQIHLGAVLKRQSGPWLWAAAVSGGYGWFDSDRFVDLPTPGVIANSDKEITYLSGHVRAAYLIERGAWYLKPKLDVDVTHIKLDGYEETGAGALNLTVDDTSETIVSATPALEIGAEYGKPGKTLYRPYLSLGATVFGDNDLSVSAKFEGTPSGVAPFAVASEFDDVIGVVSAGVDILSRSGVNLRVGYTGRFGEHTEEHSGGLKLSIDF